MLIAAGTILEGKYRVERLLGAGGMGSVWVAEHELLRRAVAVKILDSSVRKDATSVQRFLREAQTAARLRSDHIVDVLDVGKFEDGTPFLVMELLEGESLAGRIKRLKFMPQIEAATFCDQLLDGLGAAHAAGVIHRDIKPDNCFITKKNGRDHLKLLDFGISKVSGDGLEGRMTKTGVVMGTPYYMAPEQARGAKEVDHRCDLYAVGAILYECVAGRIPFDAESVNELLFKIVLEPLVPPSAFVPDLDPAFEAVLLQAMSREAKDRFQTAQAFRDALATFISPRSSPGSGTLITQPGQRIVIQASAHPSNPHVTPAGNVVVQATSSPNDPISAVGLTAPVSSAQLAAHMNARAAGGQVRPTPSGLLSGMSASGPVQLAELPIRRRSLGFVLLGVVGLGLAGGGIYVAANRSSPSAHDAREKTEAADVAEHTPKKEKKTPAQMEPIAPAQVDSATTEAPKPAIAVSTHPTTHPSPWGKKPTTTTTTPAATSAAPTTSAKVPADPPPQATTTSKPLILGTTPPPVSTPTSQNNEPRPIDEKL